MADPTIIQLARSAVATLKERIANHDRIIADIARRRAAWSGRSINRLERDRAVYVARLAQAQATLDKLTTS